MSSNFTTHTYVIFVVVAVKNQNDNIMLSTHYSHLIDNVMEEDIT